MNDASPSPFRRFPWVQLAFCLACLTMTAWTWMRYSYAWEVTPGALANADINSLLDRYVQVGAGNAPVVHAEGDGGSYWRATASDDKGQVCVVLSDAPILELPASVSRFCGRVSARKCRARIELPFAIDARKSRFHPASVAGIVVGAMGCFIFGLYLRRWLRDRKST